MHRHDWGNVHEAKRGLYTTLLTTEVRVLGLVLLFEFFVGWGGCISV